MSFWQQVLNEVKNAGYQDVEIIVEDGTRPLSDSDLDGMAEDVRRRQRRLPAGKRGGMGAFREDLYSIHRLKYATVRHEMKWLIRKAKKFGVDSADVMAMILKDLNE